MPRILKLARKGHTRESEQEKKYAPDIETGKNRAYRRELAKEKYAPRSEKGMRKGKRAYQRVEAREQIDKNFCHYIIKKDTRLKNNSNLRKQK